MWRCDDSRRPTGRECYALAAAPVDKVRTRHMVFMDSLDWSNGLTSGQMVFMDSLDYPDAVLCSESDADGSVAVAKTTTSLFEHAVGPEPTPTTSSRTARKTRNNSGKRIGTATMVSKRWQRSGVMNRKSLETGLAMSRAVSPRIAFSPSPPLLRHDALCKPLAQRNGRSARGRRRRRANILRPSWRHVKRDTLTLCMAQPQQKGEPRYLVSGWSFD